MDKMANKIKVPIKTKIAFIISFLIGLIAAMCLMEVVSYSFCEIGDSPALIHLMILLAYFQLFSLGMFLLFGVVGFFWFKNSVWGFGIFLALCSLSGLLEFLMSGLAKDGLLVASLAVVAFGAFILLLIDRKNYLAAVEKGKSKAEG
jgi:hypothetical protein